MIGRALVSTLLAMNIPKGENGFYYDFGLPRPVEPADLEWIEARMKR